MADYVERIALIVASEPFFATPDDETNGRAFFMTRDEIVPSRSDNEMDKRKGVEDSDESLVPAKAHTLDQKCPTYSSDSSTKNVSERLVVPGIPARALRGHRSSSGRRGARNSISSAAAPAVHLQLAAVPTILTAPYRPY